MLKMILTDDLYLSATKGLDDGEYIVNLTNGEKIRVWENPVHNGSTWAWKIDSQIFGKDEYARNYLYKRITEKLTGKRIILHKKGEVPDICGVDGAACRAPKACNRALCDRCPVAEKFFADRDGLELIYAV